MIKADLLAIHILCWELSQHLTNWAVFFYKVGIEADVKRRFINIGDIDDKHLGDPESWSTMSIVYTFNLLKIKVPSKQLKSWGLIMGSEVLILYTGIYFWQKYSHFQYLLLPIIIASDKSAEHVFNQLSITYIKLELIKSITTKTYLHCKYFILFIIYLPTSCHQS